MILCCWFVARPEPHQPARGGMPDSKACQPIRVEAEVSGSRVQMDLSRRARRSMAKFLMVQALHTVRTRSRPPLPSSVASAWACQPSRERLLHVGGIDVRGGEGGGEVVAQ